MSLTKKAMLASLNIKLLGMNKVDYKATADANRHLGATNESGKYQKCRIARRDVVQVLKQAEYARAIHRKLTTPFEKDWNLLPATRVMEYTSEMRDCKQKFYDAVHDVENKWPVIIANQAARLKGNLFHPREYPFVMPNGKNGGYTVLSPVDLSEHYSFDHELKPVPCKDHIIIDLEAEALDEIARDMQQKEAEKMKASKLHILKRLVEPVQNMADICLNDKKVFPSLTKNLEDVLDILPELNLADDQDVRKLLADVKAHLAGYTVGQIRNDKSLKKDLGAKAEMLSKKMDVFMTGGNAVN